LAAIASDDLWGDMTDLATPFVGKTVSNGINWVGRKIGDWLGFGGDTTDISQHVTAADTSSLTDKLVVPDRMSN